MATRSAAKAHRQSLKRRLRNRALRSATMSALKRATVTIAAGDPESSRDVVRAAMAALDRAAQKGALHPNNAARRKSRLLLKFNAAVAALQAPAEEPSPRKRKAAEQPRTSRSRAAGARKAKK